MLVGDIHIVIDYVYHVMIIETSKQQNQVTFKLKD